MTQQELGLKEVATLESVREEQPNAYQMLNNYIKLNDAVRHILEVCIREDDGSLVLGSEDVRDLEQAYKGG